jgi:TonB-linked SusC/RagA family outer membrane protein
MQLTDILHSGSLTERYLTRKLFRVMRLTTVLTFIACLHVAAKSNGQTITLDMKNVPVQKIIKEASRQSGVSVISSEDMFANTAPVSISVKNATIEEVLNQCLKNQPFTYSFEGKIIVIKPLSTPDLSRGVISPSPDSLSTLPPPIDIHGHVTDSLGAPLVGASITVKGSRKGTETDSKGDFTIYGVSDNATLTVSFTGYVKKQYKISGNNSISVSLSKSTDPLDAVQIIAYGTTTKRLSVGNITTVTAETIEKQPVQNVLLALQSQAPGLFITQANGMNGGGVTVRIQGQNSIAGGNDPFYVIDGVPYASQLLVTNFDGVLGGAGATGSGPYGISNGSPFNYLNPADIESVEILKDADATAIYGSRAANGAILITTKKGKAGAARFNLNLQQGYSEVGHFAAMMNTRQYLDMRYQAFHNDGIDWTQPGVSANDLKVWDTTRNTNWQKTLIGGTAQYTNITGSLSGGSAFVQYLVSGTYNRQTTVFPGSFADQKGSLHFSLTSASANQKFHLTFSGSYMIDDNKLPSSDLTQQAVLTEPDAPALYNKDGTLNWEPDANGVSTWHNPLATYSLATFERKTNNLISNAVLSYSIIPGLDIKTSFGYTDMRLSDYTPYPLTTVPPEDRQYASLASNFSNSTANSWIVEPQLTYRRNISRGKLDLLFGGTIQQNQANETSLQGVGYASEQLMQDLSAATTIYPIGSSFVQYKYAALYGRANYVWEDKYILDLTGRRDGSSRFGSANEYHDFWSVGAGWIFSDEEPFKNNKILSFGKLHGSYGTTGNDQIGDYQFLSLYYPTYAQGLTYQNTSGLSPAQFSNPNLQWEETHKLQGGIDLGFMNNRILLNAVYALNRSSNQLLSTILPQFTGYGAVTANLPATVQNSDWEFTLNTINIKSKDFNWTSRLNFTIPQNKLVAFPSLATSPYSYTYVIGQPLSLVRVNHFIGVDPATGQYEFADKKGNPTTTPTFPTSFTDPEDFNIIKNLTPKFYGGFQNTFSYKGIQLDFTFGFVKQLGRNYSYYNGTPTTPGAFYSGNSNQLTTVLNHWQKPGDVAPVTAYSTQFSYGIGYMQSSDYAYTDASYLRLQNVSLSADEFTLYSAVATSDPMYFYYTNTLFATSQTGMGSDYWVQGYGNNGIYTCNASIEGLNSSSLLTPSVKQQLLGESYFMRGLFYFYLVNLYGEVPLLTSTDYKSNALLPRATTQQIFTQIISDLKTAQGLLSSNYEDGMLAPYGTNPQRVRPTKWAADALLARTYLYEKDYPDAVLQADSVISNAAIYSLDTLNGVFLMNSSEAIWQLQPTNSTHNTEDGWLFILPPTGPSAGYPPYPVYLSNDLLSAFEPGDQRRTNWVDSVIVAADTFYYPYKYKSATLGAPLTEYQMILRLGEQYLIRAEAEANGASGGTSAAIADLNVIRNRAGLNNYSGATDQTSVLNAIMRERQVELFTELGQRWLDLKRTGAVDAVMTQACSRKDGSTWNSYQQLYPVQNTDILADPYLTQNPGYAF